MVVVMTRAVNSLRLKTFVILFLLLCPPGGWVPLSLAQVTPPVTSSGLHTQVSAPMNLPSGKVQYDITGGTRPGGGANLFHSFGNFNVPANNIANFLNDSGLATSNILGRVTAGNPSNIFGMIQTTGFGNANLFLMNPAGIILGPTATLDVGGMATFTTADYLRLADGNLFRAMPNATADALLSAAPVAAFGFLGSNPGAITVQGSQLSVKPGQGISLVGGDITVQSGTLENGTVQPAQLTAPGGRIHLASVASPGEILTGTLEQASNINGQSFGALGTIQISEKSIIDASGDGGGTVLIRGGRFVLDDSTISANTTGPATGSLTGPGEGIDIQVSQDAVIRNLAVLETNVSENVAPGIGSDGVRVKADRIEIAGVPDFDNFPFTGIRSNVAAMSTGGNSGNIKLEANSILVKDLAHVETRTGGAGNAGNISLRTNGDLEIHNLGFIVSSSEPAASGNAGNIELMSTHGNISMTTPFVTSQSVIDSNGNAGKITVSAPRGDIVLTDQGSLANYNAGAGALPGIEITANNLKILNASSISGDNFNAQVPGNITVSLTGNLTLDGNSNIATIARGPAAAANLNIMAKNVSITGQSFLSTESKSSGPGGQVNIFTENLRMTSGGQIRSGSTLGQDPRTGEHVIPSGRGGTITIQGLASPAQSVIIDGAESGIFTDAVGTGAGGNIHLNAQSVSLLDGGTLSATSSGTASQATGGAIIVQANQVQVNNGATVSASSTGAGNAGNITITGNTFQSNHGTVSTDATQARGGNITINTAQSVSLASDAAVSASSSGPGNAGDIMIGSGSQFLSTDSRVTTQASQASGGNITVTAADLIRLMNSQINTSVHGSAATTGGNITIDPHVVILQNSQVLAQATQGTGGNIGITTNLLFPDATSLVDASSQTGVSGTVAIQSPISQAGGKIIPLAKAPLLPAALLAERCAAAPRGGFSSFIVAGHDTVPTEPGGWLASPLLDLGADAVFEAGSQVTTPFLAKIMSRWQPSSPWTRPSIFSPEWTASCGS